MHNFKPMGGVDMKLHKEEQLNEERHMKGNFKYMNSKLLPAQKSNEGSAIRREL